MNFVFDSLEDALNQLAPYSSAQDEPKDNIDQFTEEEPVKDKSVLSAALAYLRNGISVLPIKADGSKAPAISGWKRLQNSRLTEEEAQHHFSGSAGIGIIGGAISGNLEVLDFDEAGLLPKFLDLLGAFGLDYLRDRLVIASTPDGGHHVYYRCIEPIRGSSRLAETADKGVRIETRGEGAYAIVPPSPAACHPKGLPYSLVQGDLSCPPVLTLMECERLRACAVAFNLLPAEQRTEEALCGVQSSSPGLRPGDDFNARARWKNILGPHGWECVKETGEITYWQRPGKDGPGISATINEGGNGIFYNFSTNSLHFEANTSYSKFAATAILNHAGDYKAAAKQLASQGFGDKISSGHQSGKAVSDSSILDRPVFRLSDVGNAERLVYAHGDNLRYIPQWDKWLTWNGSRWVVDDTGEVHRLAKKTALNIYQEATQEADDARRVQLSKHACRSESQSSLLAMVKLAQTEEKIPLRIPQLDTHRMLLNCLNGTLDLVTGELRPHKREDYCTKIIPIAYDQQAVCPRWEAFLDRIFAGNQELISFVQRAIGSALTGEMRDQCLFFLYGNGANGKSTFIETVRAMLADYALETPPETLMVKRNDGGISNDVARLRGARFVSARESEEGGKLSESFVKHITGGDTITARFLHKEFFEFNPEFKLFLATNHRPVIRGTDEGIWRRIRLIPFEVSIPDAERDPYLPKKLLDELPGILAWAVRGCLQWQAEGLGQPEVVKAATAAYRAEMDTFGSFLEERCYLGEKTGDKTCVRADQLYQAYIKWCGDNGEHIQTQQCFGRRLTERGLPSEKRGGVCYRNGIGLLASSEYTR